MPHDFGPGKIDGNYGGFTGQSVALLSERRRAKQRRKTPSTSKRAPLASDDPIYLDVHGHAAGPGLPSRPMPPELAEQAKGKRCLMRA